MFSLRLVSDTPEEELRVAREEFRLGLIRALYPVAMNEQARHSLTRLVDDNVIPLVEEYVGEMLHASLQHVMSGLSVSEEESQVG